MSTHLLRALSLAATLALLPVAGCAPVTDESAVDELTEARGEAPAADAPTTPRAPLAEPAGGALPDRLPMARASSAPRVAFEDAVVAAGSAHGASVAPLPAAKAYDETQLGVVARRAVALAVGAPVAQVEVADRTACAPEVDCVKSFTGVVARYDRDLARSLAAAVARLPAGVTELPATSWSLPYAAREAAVTLHGRLDGRLIGVVFVP